jgi:hypothetical protein
MELRDIENQVVKWINLDKNMNKMGAYVNSVMSL